MSIINEKSLEKNIPQSSEGVKKFMAQENGYYLSEDEEETPYKDIKSLSFIYERVSAK